MISLDNARSILCSELQQLPPLEVATGQAIGCKLTRAAYSDLDLPSADVSAMDGYAARYDDLVHQNRFQVAFEVAAGCRPGHLQPGRVARIFTGAMLPEGADTVIAQEQAHVATDDTVSFDSCRKGDHVRKRGEVIAAGEELSASGAWVTPQSVAMLAACGAERLFVVPKPRISVVVTGAELVPSSNKPEPGQIRDSNGPLLTALVRAANLEPPTIFHAGDRKNDLIDAISSAFDSADLVLTTGGVSVGAYDLVPAAVRELGGHVHFHSVRMKPGKPVLAAQCKNQWLLGLPGNPLAVLVGWRLLALPLAAGLSGNKELFSEKPFSASVTNLSRAPKTRTEIRPAYLEIIDGCPTVSVRSWKGSHDVVAAARGNALARLEPGREYPIGSHVPCYPLESGSLRFENTWRLNR